MTTFNVYKVSYAFGTIRTRYALFVEAEENSSGYFIHVFGDVQQGMDYKAYGSGGGRGIKAENVDGFLGKEHLGVVQEVKLMDFMDACEMVPPPWKQLDTLGRRIDRERPLYRDREWVEEVVQKLKDVGILQAV
jgi:hypothetical protein